MREEKLCVCRRCFCVIKPNKKFLLNTFLLLFNERKYEKIICATKFIHEIKSKNIFGVSFLLLEKKEKKTSKKFLDDANLQKIKIALQNLKTIP